MATKTNGTRAHRFGPRAGAIGGEERDRLWELTSSRADEIRALLFCTPLARRYSPPELRYIWDYFGRAEWRINNVGFCAYI